MVTALRMAKQHLFNHQGYIGAYLIIGKNLALFSGKFIHNSRAFVGKLERKKRSLKRERKKGRGVGNTREKNENSRKKRGLTVKNRSRPKISERRLRG